MHYLVEIQDLKGKYVVDNIDEYLRTRLLAEF